MTDNTHIHDLRFYQKDIKPTIYNQDIEQSKPKTEQPPNQAITYSSDINSLAVQLILFNHIIKGYAV